MNVLSLFSGIGGLELGLERAGMTVVGQVEIDEFCWRVLAKHWPEVPRHDDVRTAAEWWLGDTRPTVDLVCGGFPCQPVSLIGKRRAQEDPRWLWPWMADVIRRIRPRYVLVENVPGLLSAGLGDVLGDLAGLGFDAEWSMLSACAVGAPHTRERLFILAYPAGADVEQAGEVPPPLPPGRAGAGAAGGDAWGTSWLPEPAVDRVAYGVPRSVGFDQLQALGNAIVPQVAEHVGRLILAADAEREAAA
jgi:DNA (cytosine-5)-methyltransferase 1